MTATVRVESLAADVERIRDCLEGAPADLPLARSAPLTGLADRLGMSPFERDVLLLAASVELDGQVASLIAQRHGDVRATFALAMAVLPDPHWDALAPHRPLRRWRLIGLEPGSTLTTRPIGIDEHILHLLTGIADDCGTQPLTAITPAAGLSSTQGALAAETAAAVLAVPWPVRIVLHGTDPAGRLAVAERIAEHLGMTPLRVADAAIGSDAAGAALLLDRAAMISDRLIITGHGALLAMLRTPVAVALADPPPGPETLLVRSVELPGPAEQAAMWRSHAPEAPEPVLADLAQHYRLGDRAIAAIAGQWRADGAGEEALRILTRQRARVGLGPLAQRLEPRASWQDLVLPAGQLAQLHDLVTHVRHRAQVYQEWGFAQQSERGLGITALFAGESGTGKTMAAEVIAAELGHDLYRIDLAAVVSKYIGETEKNLAALFDAAESSGAVLLFDEADALFGRRSDVKDSHDRYANIEVAYLLQRMEAYRGLAILTTNMRSTIDRAFLRRLRFVVHFPFPDEAARALIWGRMFPAQAPVTALDPAALAALQISGGSIRAIAVSAAFAAAHDEVPIGPEQVLRAAAAEYAKGERQLSAAESAALRGPR